MISGMSYPEFSAHIKKVRGKAGLSLSKVASIMTEINPTFGVGRQWVHHAESGTQNLTIKKIELLCQALDKRLEMVALTDDEVVVKISRADASLLEGLADDEQTKKDIIEIVRGLLMVDNAAIRTILNLVRMTVSGEMNEDQRKVLEP